jgi:hypothetical protein
VLFRSLWFVENHVHEFDELIYIGHSRHGSGLAFGPFTPDFTWKPRFYNSHDIGRLKKIYMASCKADEYYAPYLRKHFQFDGLTGAVDWESQMLPAVLRELSQILRSRPQLY